MSTDDTGPQSVVQIETGPQKWRYRCPNGHADWHVINGVFKCRTCERHASAGEDVDPHHTVLVDQVTNDRINRERVEIVLGDETIKW